MERITTMENGCSQRHCNFSSYFSFSTQENSYKRFTGRVTSAYDLKTADEIQTFLRFPGGAVTPGERVERQLGWGEELAPQICFPPTCSFHPYKHPRRTCPALSRSFGQIKATVPQVYFTQRQVDWWQRNKTGTWVAFHGKRFILNNYGVCPQCIEIKAINRVTETEANLSLEFKQWKMSGVGRNVVKSFSRLQFYAESVFGCLPTFRDNLSVQSSAVKHSTNTLDCLTLDVWADLLLKEWTDTLSQKSVTIYQTKQRNIPEEWRPRP